MKKYISATLAAMLFTSSAFAASQNFFQEDVRPGAFYVHGVTSDPEKVNDNPACFAQVDWKDGSRFQLTRDLADAELYIFFRNHSWNINDKPGTYRLRANFTKNNKITGGIDFNYTLVNKNTIVINNINKDTFIPMFTSNSLMTFVMPGSIQNSELDLTGTTKVLAEISRCIEVARGVDLYPEGAPANSNTNRSRIPNNI